MGEELLAKFITEMTNVIKATKDFAMEQIPQVAQEVLKYQFYISLMWLCIGIICCALTLKFTKWVNKLTEKDFDYAPMYVVMIFLWIM